MPMTPPTLGGKLTSPEEVETPSSSQRPVRPESSGSLGAGPCREASEVGESLEGGQRPTTRTRAALSSSVGRVTGGDGPTRSNMDGDHDPFDDIDAASDCVELLGSSGTLSAWELPPDKPDPMLNSVIGEGFQIPV